jgi:hypothetical protein
MQKMHKSLIFFLTFPHFLLIIRTSRDKEQHRKTTNMAKYTVTHTCGHEHEYNLFGKHTERERKIEWLEKQDCPACRRKAEEEAAKAATEGVELPELEGSEKQVKWANTIRGTMIEAARKNSVCADEVKDKMISVVASVTSAKEFIDNRNLPVEFFVLEISKKRRAVKKALEAIQKPAETPAPAKVEEVPATEQKAPQKAAEWRKVVINAQNVECTTERGVKIKLPHSSKHDGYSVWVSLKLLRQGRHSYEYMLSIKADMEFTLTKYGHGKWNKFKKLGEKTISAEEMAAAFGGWVSDAPRFSEPAVDPDKEEIVKHVPAPLAPVEIEADPELVR